MDVKLRSYLNFVALVGAPYKKPDTNDRVLLHHDFISYYDIHVLDDLSSFKK